MKITTGEKYQSSDYAKSLCASESKVGKTSFLVAGALGQLPWQKQGGLVDDPKNLHLVTFDANAAGGLKQFLLQTCGAPKEALNFTVWNMQEDLFDIGTSKTEWDFTFYNAICGAIQQVKQAAKGVPCVIFSSLTSIGEGIFRGLSGPQGNKKGSGMDEAKWSSFFQQISDIRYLGHDGPWHCLWEAHVLKQEKKDRSGENSIVETIQIPGKAGTNFPNNVEQAFRIRRNFNTPFQGSKCDQVYFDTRPTYEFIAGGRGFTENLEPREPCVASAFQRLGLKVGGWGAKAMPVKAVK